MRRAVHAPVGYDKTHSLMSSIMTKTYRYSPVFIQAVSPQRTARPKVEVVEMDDFALPGTMNSLREQTRHLLSRFGVNEMYN